MLFINQHRDTLPGFNPDAITITPEQRDELIERAKQRQTRRRRPFIRQARTSRVQQPERKGDHDTTRVHFFRQHEPHTAHGVVSFNTSSRPRRRRSLMAECIRQIVAGLRVVLKVARAGGKAQHRYRSFNGGVGG